MWRFIKKIIKKINRMGIIWIFICIILLVIIIASKRGFLYNSLKLILFKDHQFQWASVSGFTAVFALAVTWWTNSRSVKGNIVSASRVEWLSRFKESLTEYTNTCYKLKNTHEDFIRLTNRWLNESNQAKIQSQRDAYRAKRLSYEKSSETIGNFKKERQNRLLSLHKKYKKKSLEQIAVPDIINIGKKDFFRSKKLIKAGNEAQIYDENKVKVEFKFFNVVSKTIAQAEQGTIFKQRNLLKVSLENAIKNDSTFGQEYINYLNKVEDSVYELKRLESYIKIELSSNKENNQFIYLINELSIFLVSTKVLILVADKKEIDRWNSEYDFTISMLMGYSRKYLKKEWEKIKQE